ncbi:MAG: hypothetical protein ABFD08_04800 [Syntrophomonas sp.]
MKSYKLISLSLAVIFAVVGLLFLLAPSGVLGFFNIVSKYLGMAPSTEQGSNFYLILAVGYMYLVTLLAYFMYRNPEDSKFPLLLANGKLASSILSIFMFILHKPYLIYITNGVVDGFIGLLVIFIYLKMKRAAQ